MPLLTQSALLKALGWTLFNSLWQMGLLWLFYWVVVSVTRSISSHSRHNLATGLLGIGAIGSGVEFVYRYFFADAFGSHITRPGNWLLGAETGYFLAGGSFWQTARLTINGLLPWCTALYLLVLGILLVRYSNHYFHSRRLKYSGLCKMQPELRVFVESTSRRMGIRRPVQAWLSSLIDVPLTLGLLRPVILLPVAMANNLTLEQAETILLHELAHIRRNDYLVNLGVIVLELLFFFNPFYRLLIRELKREREHRCDDWVMQFRYDPQTYVSALLSLATHTIHAGDRRQQSLALAATGGGSDRLLLQRVKRILRQRSSGDRPGSRPLILLFFTLAIALFGLSGLSHAPQSAGNHTDRQQDMLRAGAFSLSGQPGRDTLLSAPAMPLVGVEGTLYIREINVTLATPSDRKAPRPIRVRIEPRKRSKPAVVRDEQGMEDVYGDNNGMMLLTDGDASAPAVAMAEDVETAPQPDNREYSISTGPSTAAAGILSPGQKRRNDNLPFVPQSSFSFQYMEDPAHPDEQRAYQQEYNEQEIAATLQRMQQDLMVQLQNLQKTKGGQVHANLKIITQRELLDQQMKLQEQYQQKVDALQKRLQATGRRMLRIVYI